MKETARDAGFEFSKITRVVSTVSIGELPARNCTRNGYEDQQESSGVFLHHLVSIFASNRDIALAVRPTWPTLVSAVLHDDGLEQQPRGEWGGYEFHSLQFLATRKH